jgi:hypothetical protein
LDQQALLQITRRDTDRVEVLDHLEHERRVVAVQLRFVGEILDRQVGGARPILALDALQVQQAIIFEVTNNQFAKAALDVCEISQLQLPQQVILQRARPREALLNRGELIEPRRAFGGSRLLLATVL